MRTIFCLLAALEAVSVRAETRAPEHRVVRVSSEVAVAPSEVSVAINPERPENVVAVSLQRRSPTTDFAYVSFDGGNSWASIDGPNPNGRTQGDDAVAFDDKGRALWSYISFKGLHSERPVNPANGIFVNRSADGGRNWSTPTTVVDHRNTVAPFEDKPYLASAAHDRVYVAWTRFSKYGSADPRETSHIFFALSEDGGKSFETPYRVSDEPGDAIDSDGTLEGVVPAVGVNGEVFLVWSGPRGLELDMSTDGGWTFGEDRVIGAHPGGWDIDIEGVGRANGMPVAGVDHSGGPFRGTVYVNWIDDRHGDPDVFVTYSRDGGKSWAEPVRANADAVGNGAAQFSTWMAIDAVDGSVNVVFYDRDGLSGTATRVTLARSVDGGTSFETYPLAMEPFETSAETFFGDYIGVAAHDGRVVTVFSHFTSASDLALSAGLFRF